MEAILKTVFEETVEVLEFLSVEPVSYTHLDKIRTVSNYILELILKCNYETDNSNINYYVTNIKGSIAYLDFLLDRLYDMKYINDKLSLIHI